MTAGFGNASGMDTRVRTAVKAMRLRLEMQQRDLAKAVAVSRQTLSSIEAGETVPSTQIALALARELRCRVEDLFSLRGDGQVLEAEFVPEADRSPGDGHKTRVSLGWVGERWVARLLETDEALALGTPADGIATLSKGKGKWTKRASVPFAIWNLFIAIFWSRAAIPRSACWGAIWRSVSTVLGCIGSRRQVGPRWRNWRWGGCTSPGCTFWARAGWARTWLPFVKGLAASPWCW